MRQRHQGLTVALAAVLLTCGAAFADATKGNVDELRFGTAVDAKGVVPASTHAESFIPTDTIHVTMRVQEAPPNQALVLSIFDRETERLVWSQEQPVSGGHSTMHFVIPAGAVPAGKYRAKVKLGPDGVAEHEFSIK